MFIAAAPLHHVEHLRAHGDDAFPYLSGEEGESSPGLLGRLLGRAAPTPVRPADWPARGGLDTVQLDDNLGTNARAMHFMLHGSDHPVGGAGDLFRAWFAAADRHTERIGGRNGHVFVHSPAQAAELARTLTALDRTALKERWRRLNAKLGLADRDEEFAYIDECFAALESEYTKAAAAGHCVVFAPREQ
jgi:hypothetical protein